MNSIDTLATFFGWCTVVNVGLLLLAMLVFSVFRDIFATITAKMFGANATGRRSPSSAELTVVHRRKKRR